MPKVAHSARSVRNKFWFLFHCLSSTINCLACYVSKYLDQQHSSLNSPGLNLFSFFWQIWWTRSNYPGLNLFSFSWNIWWTRSKRTYFSHPLSTLNYPGLNLFSFFWKIWWTLSKSTYFKPQKVLLSSQTGYRPLFHRSFFTVVVLASLKIPVER